MLYAAKLIYNKNVINRQEGIVRELTRKDLAVANVWLLPNKKIFPC